MTFWNILIGLCLFLGLMLIGSHLVNLISVESSEDEAIDRAIAECDAKIKARMRR